MAPGAVIDHGGRFYILVGYASAGTALALAIQPQTSPLRRDQVRLSPDDAQRFGLRRLTSVISTAGADVVALSASHVAHVIADGSALLSRIETTARRSRETACIERPDIGLSPQVGGAPRVSDVSLPRQRAGQQA